MKITRRHSLRAASVVLFTRTWAAEIARAPWGDKLERIRTQHDLPGLAAALVGPTGVTSWAVTGVRKKGASELINPQDEWHLGSNTKAMTAMLAALAVQEKKLRWDSSLGEIFPRQTDLKKSPLAAATLTQLLSHGSGLPANALWGLFGLSGTIDLRAQRASVLELAARTPDLPKPGSRHEYSNWGYVLAGHMLETVWDASWEELMQRRLFQPLGIQRAGFGGLGTPGENDQPWPHDGKGEPMPNNGPLVDNPAVLGPAGTVHMALEDWGRFIAEHLAGRAGKGRLLSGKAAYEHLHTATQPPEPYAYGWITLERKWGGRVLHHGGSNTMNHSVAWLAPEKGFAVIACTNSGSEKAPLALDQAASLLIQQHQA